MPPKTKSWVRHCHAAALAWQLRRYVINVSEPS